MTDISKKSFIHPILFGFFPILLILSYNVYLLTFQEVFFPVLIIVGISFLSWILLSKIFKNQNKSGLVISLSLVLFFTYGHVFLLLDNISLENVDIGRHRYLIIPFFVSFLAGMFYLIKTKRKLDNLTLIVNTIATVIIIMSLANIGMNYFNEDYSLKSLGIIEEYNSELFADDVFNSPNVYYIILDAYAGSDALENVYEYDNSEFILFMEKHGFFIATKSHSNYESTLTSLASTLNMKYLDYFNENTRFISKRIFTQMIHENQVMKNFDDLGYKIINLNSGPRMTTNFQFADENLCGISNFYFNSELMIVLAKTSILNPVHVIIFEDSRRDMVLCVFNELIGMKHNSMEPTFVFAHIIIPHPGFIFGPDGEPKTPKTLLGNVYDDKMGYLDQLKFTNKKIKEVIDVILKQNQNSIIIVQGDHGSAFNLDWENPSDNALRERTSILNYYHLPNNKNKLYDDITPVNSFRIIFNSYFNGNYDLLEDKVFFTGGGLSDKPYTDVTRIVNSEWDIPKTGT